MSLEQSVSFFVFALVAAITPGPSNVMLTATGAAAGVWRGLPCMVGVSAGMGSLIFGVGLGLGNLVLGYPAVLQALNWAGAAFLLWLAWKIATAPPLAAGAAGRPVGFLEAAGFQWINPKSWLVGTSAVGAYLQADGAGALPQAAWLAALFVLAAAPSNLVWLAFGASMQLVLRSARAARIFNIAMAAGLAASIAMILW
ncbi:MAG: LysE family translocator [Alphaproteobacteria bacterium]|nr:LysE family translocator [Alphaproteobacteria bacterium]